MACLASQLPNGRNLKLLLNMQKREFTTCAGAKLGRMDGKMNGSSTEATPQEASGTEALEAVPGGPTDLSQEAGAVTSADGSSSVCPEGHLGRRCCNRILIYGPHFPEVGKS